MLIERRSLLRGLFAAPAIIAADRLMPVKIWRAEAPPEFLMAMGGSLHKWQEGPVGRWVIIGAAPRLKFYIQGPSWKALLSMTNEHGEAFRGDLRNTPAISRNESGLSSSIV